MTRVILHLVGALLLLLGGLGSFTMLQLILSRASAGGGFFGEVTFALSLLVAGMGALLIGVARLIGAIESQRDAGDTPRPVATPPAPRADPIMSAAEYAAEKAATRERAERMGVVPR